MVTRIGNNKKPVCKHILMISVAHPADLTGLGTISGHFFRKILEIPAGHLSAVSNEQLSGFDESVINCFGMDDVAEISRNDLLFSNNVISIVYKGDISSAEAVVTVLDTFEHKPIKSLIIESEKVCRDHSDKQKCIENILKKKDWLSTIDFQCWYLNELVPAKCVFLEQADLEVFINGERAVCPRLTDEGFVHITKSEVDTLKRKLIVARLEQYLMMQKRFSCIECRKVFGTVSHTMPVNLKECIYEK
ncbi:hypothetical protein [Marispirochaeta aestuarii]|nr:hypothetical protein [Marispirochaeta aestuarii]